MIDIILDEFHFSTLWNGGILLFLLFGAIIYLFLLPDDRNHSSRKTILFFAGLIILFLAIGSPLNIIGRITFSTHIIQIVLLLFVVPPLFIIGFKMKIIGQLMAITTVGKAMQKITHPLSAIVVFHLLFYGYHIPALFNYVRIDIFLNYLYLLALFIGALLLWIPILSPNQLSFSQKLKYCVVNSILMIPFNLILLFSKDGLFSIYTDINLFVTALEFCLPDWETIPDDVFELLLPFNPVKEQQNGGIILMVSQLIMFSVMLLLTKRIND
ncbi:cytochrome c oxidase assembly protein [Virgibacillus sp. C22-A2]|uniref:Cytochrome c oxidase assembly protein n=1 Tax=Virgibacillus tibetensis TaxID=3042313 RepID=A0ABU6KEL9_9BACI|nr:cytochrome c oxidase assembly protein [Virgibacillus sp. C22-A2]